MQIISSNIVIILFDKHNIKEYDYNYDYELNYTELLLTRKNINR